ncbi:Hypothetical protein MVR_LOCUS152 [uncultured virus]|nr:Hypothetical protein MVR_LOCUS152 [uncultured virus]
MKFYNINDTGYYLFRDVRKRQHHRYRGHYDAYAFIIIHNLVKGDDYVYAHLEGTKWVKTNKPVEGVDKLFIRDAWYMDNYDTDDDDSESSTEDETEYETRDAVQCLKDFHSEERHKKNKQLLEKDTRILRMERSIERLERELAEANHAIKVLTTELELATASSKPKSTSKRKSKK